MDAKVVQDISKKLMIVGAATMVAVPAVLLVIQEIEHRIAAKRTGQPIKRLIGNVTRPLYKFVEEDPK